MDYSGFTGTGGKWITVIHQANDVIDMSLKNNDLSHILRNTKHGINRRIAYDF